MEHVPGKLDFTVETKEFSVTDFRRRISSVWRDVEVPGCIAVISRKGKPGEGGGDNRVRQVIQRRARG